LEVLKAHPNDESTIHWSLCLLTRAWSCEGIAGSHAATLGELAGDFNHSPSFLSHLAVAQYHAGQKQEAMENVDRALALAPGYALAAAYRAAWIAAPPGRSMLI
jgi:Flp pilus assembly protein TadD